MEKKQQFIGGYDVHNSYSTFTGREQTQYTNKLVEVAVCGKYDMRNVFDKAPQKLWWS